VQKFPNRSERGKQVRFFCWPGYCFDSLEDLGLAILFVGRVSTCIWPSTGRCRTTNWPSYSGSFRWRESLLIWLDKDKARLAPPDGKAGRPAVISDARSGFA